jgi:hypothetical protein
MYKEDRSPARLDSSSGLDSPPPLKTRLAVARAKVAAACSAVSAADSDTGSSVGRPLSLHSLDRSEPTTPTPKDISSTVTGARVAAMRCRQLPHPMLRNLSDLGPRIACTTAGRAALRAIAPPVDCHRQRQQAAAPDNSTESVDADDPADPPPTASRTRRQPSIVCEKDEDDLDHLPSADVTDNDVTLVVDRSADDDEDGGRSSAASNAEKYLEDLNEQLNAPSNFSDNSPLPRPIIYDSNSSQSQQHVVSVVQPPAQSPVIELQTVVSM